MKYRLGCFLTIVVTMVFAGLVATPSYHGVQTFFASGVTPPTFSTFVVALAASTFLAGVLAGCLLLVFLNAIDGVAAPGQIVNSSGTETFADDHPGGPELDSSSNRA